MPAERRCIINAIVAVSRSWGIGLDNRLLFNIPDDMAYFRDMTTGTTVIMGRKTLLTMPGEKPLKNRRNLILSTHPEFKTEGGIVLPGVGHLLSYLYGIDGEVFVIGGEQVYRQLLPYCRKAYVTLVDSDPPADRFFPNLDEHPNWELSVRGEQREQNGVSFAFCEYVSREYESCEGEKGSGHDHADN